VVDPFLLSALTTYCPTSVGRHWTISREYSFLAPSTLYLEEVASMGLPSLSQVMEVASFSSLIGKTAAAFSATVKDGGNFLKAGCFLFSPGRSVELLLYE